MIDREKISPFEFAKYALQRNDEAIRYSETKAGFLLAFIGLLFTAVVGELDNIKQILKIYSCPSTILIYTSIILIFPSIIFLIIICLAIVMPRLHLTHSSSFLFFGNLASIDEESLQNKFNKFTSQDMNRQVLVQVHVTAKIAYTKFKLIRVANILTGIILFGSILVIIALILAP